MIRLEAKTWCDNQQQSTLNPLSETLTGRAQERRQSVIQGIQTSGRPGVNTVALSALWQGGGQGVRYLFSLPACYRLAGRYRIRPLQKFDRLDES